MMYLEHNIDSVIFLPQPVAYCNHNPKKISDKNKQDICTKFFKSYNVSQ